MHGAKYVHVDFCNVMAHAPRVTLTWCTIANLLDVCNLANYKCLDCNVSIVQIAKNPYFTAFRARPCLNFAMKEQG